MFVSSSSHLWLLRAAIRVAVVIGTKLEMTPVQCLGGLCNVCVSSGGLGP